jgi:GGDEF domain-containing protein
MPKVNRGMGLLVIGLAVAALVVSQVGSTVAQTAGREFSRCIQSCNETRKGCNRACSDDCRVLYPDGGSMLDACIADCKTGTCVPNSEECKQICENIKDPPSPEEP